MLDHAVYEQEAVALRLGVEGEVLVFEALAVEADEVTCLTEDGGKLVHDTTLHPDIVVLGGLAYLGKFELVDAEG